jgi:hypothetical protein
MLEYFEGGGKREVVGGFGWFHWRCSVFLPLRRWRPSPRWTTLRTGEWLEVLEEGVRRL